MGSNVEMKSPYLVKKYKLDEKVYFNFKELLMYLRVYFNIDYENFILKVKYIIEFNYAEFNAIYFILIL